jgi:hypothetical protein
MIFLWNHLSLQRRLDHVKSNVEAQELCDNLAFEINSAVKAGKGYKRSFLLEGSIHGTSDFDISIANYSIFIDWNGNSVVSNIITREINGTIEKGRWNVIKNINGAINVTQS